MNTLKSGLLLLHKKPGVTSFEALFPVKRALGSGKAGHTGTLDKFAQGLLLVLTGRALKLSPWFTHCGKEYEALIRFGEETDTLDPEGSVIAEGAVPSREAVERVLPQFTGEILQAPPAYSAIHIDGKRAHELARSGEAVEMKKRPVTIYSLELASWEPPFAGIRLCCSSGAYVRSLARDLALAAGSRGRLDALCRTAVAGFSLDDAIDPGSPGEEAAEVLRARIQPINREIIAKLGLPRFDLGPEMLEKIIHGKPISGELDKAEPVFPPSSGPWSLGETPVLGVCRAEPISMKKNAQKARFLLCKLPKEPQNRDFCVGFGAKIHKSDRLLAAALFCGETFAGIAERKAGKSWGYGCVYSP